MKKRLNIAFIPVNTENEKYIFDNGVRSKYPISIVENLLFDKLLDELKKSHPSGLFSIWGIGTGKNSSDANNWNKLNSNDLLLFQTSIDSVVIAKVAEKFQSENVANQIWPDSSERDVPQYVATIDKILHSELVGNKYFTKTFANRISILSAFEVFENLELADIFSEKTLTSNLFLDFISGPEDVQGSFMSAISDGYIYDTSSISSTIKGLGLSAAERKIIEMHAVTLAKEHFKMMGYSKIEDVGNFESFDLKVQNETETLYVEVKGTTTKGDSIVLTRNEVDLHLRVFPNNALFLVTQIQINQGDDLKVSGGVVKVLSPWKIIEDNLSVIAFNYRL